MLLRKNDLCTETKLRQLKKNIAINPIYKKSFQEN